MCFNIPVFKNKMTVLYCDLLTFTILLANSADDKSVIFFLIFFFQENRIRKFMQIVSNLHEMSNPVFWVKQEKYFKMSSEIFTQSAKR